MVKIRLRRVGAKKQPHYRVVVTDAKSPRDGKFLENIGHYNPRTEPPTIEIDAERAIYWLGVGAQPTEAVRRMLGKLGILDRFAAIKRGEILAEEEAEVVELVLAEEEAGATEEEFVEEKELVEAEVDEEPLTTEDEEDELDEDSFDAEEGFDEDEDLWNSEDDEAEDSDLDDWELDEEEDEDDNDDHDDDEDQSFDEDDE